MNVKRNMRMSPQKTARVTSATLPAENMTLLAFLGRGSNVRPYYGAAPVYQRYEFGGKHKVRNVLDSDVPVLLGMKENGKPLFEIVKIVKAPAVVAKVIIPEPVAKVMPEPVPGKKVVKKKVASKKKPNA